jgi:hypothetical protein
VTYAGLLPASAGFFTPLPCRSRILIGHDTTEKWRTRVEAVLLCLRTGPLTLLLAKNASNTTTLCKEKKRAIGLEPA